MKSVVTENEQAKQEKKYPYLGISKHLDKSRWVVLFTSKEKGVLVHNSNKSDSPYFLGYESSYWGEIDFIPFTGTIELSND